MNSLKGYFLIAMPSLMDPHFFRSVTYLCDHTEEGALGIVINQPLANLRLANILEQMGIQTEYPEIENHIVFSGGPVHPERGFILHESGKKWQSTTEVNDTIALTTSPDILQAIARNEGPNHKLIALGYANWEQGQLEKEMSENAWLYAPANIDILFHMSIEYRWKAAAALMGVDVDRLSNDIGHA